MFLLAAMSYVRLTLRLQLDIVKMRLVSPREKSLRVSAWNCARRWRTGIGQDK